MKYRIYKKNPIPYIALRGRIEAENPFGLVYYFNFNKNLKVVNLFLMFEFAVPKKIHEDLGTLAV